MMKHVDKASTIHELRASGKLKEFRGELSAEARMIEEFLYGFLEGMSFKEQASCYSGLTSMIYQGFEALNYREVYKPWNTLKFTVATQKFSEATNVVYA